jgi:hypothetical protein
MVAAQFGSKRADLKDIGRGERKVVIAVKLRQLTGRQKPDLARVHMPWSIGHYVEL